MFHDSRRFDFGFPFQLDDQGRIYDPSYEDHVRQMVELVLLTSPGERFYRPDFGCGLLELVFETAADVALEGTAVYMVRNALERWLSDVLQVLDVQLRGSDHALHLEVEYALLTDGSEHRAVFDLDIP